MKEVLKKLNLQDSATEETAVQAIEKLQQEAQQLKRILEKIKKKNYLTWSKKPSKTVSLWPTKKRYSCK